MTNPQASCGVADVGNETVRIDCSGATKKRSRVSSSCQRRSRSWTQAGTSPIRSYVSVIGRMPSATGSMSDASRQAWLISA